MCKRREKENKTFLVLLFAYNTMEELKNTAQLTDIFLKGSFLLKH